MGGSFYEVTVSSRQCKAPFSSRRIYTAETSGTTQLVSVACDLCRNIQWYRLSPRNHSCGRRTAVSVYEEEILLQILQLEHKNFMFSLFTVFLKWNMYVAYMYKYTDFLYTLYLRVRQAVDYFWRSYFSLVYLQNSFVFYKTLWTIIVFTTSRHRLCSEQNKTDNQSH